MKNSRPMMAMEIVVLRAESDTGISSETASCVGMAWGRDWMVVAVPAIRDQFIVATSPEQNDCTACVAIRFDGRSNRPKPNFKLTWATITLV
jgi:hypothetical protein